VDKALYGNRIFDANFQFEIFRGFPEVTSVTGASMVT
jgi:hypothetical protein